MVNSLTELVFFLLSLFFQTYHNYLWMNCWVRVLTRHQVLDRGIMPLPAGFLTPSPPHVELTAPSENLHWDYLFTYLTSADVSILTVFNTAEHPHCPFCCLAHRRSSMRFEGSVSQPIIAFFLWLPVGPQEPAHYQIVKEWEKECLNSQARVTVRFLLSGWLFVSLNKIGNRRGKADKRKPWLEN